MAAPRPRARRAALASAAFTLAAFTLAALLAASPAAAELRGALDPVAGGEAPPAAAPPEPADPRLAEVPAPGYRVRPVEGAPTRPGVRRTLETFAGWTLICDDARGRRVCNAAQSIAAADGSLAFSWSLAATKGGEPVFVVRAPVMGFPSRTVALDFGGGESVIRLPACDARLCLGFLPLDPAILRRIREKGSVAIRYHAREGSAPVRLTASLDGLGAAIGSLR